MAGRTVLARQARPPQTAIEAVREGRPIEDPCLEASSRLADAVTAERGHVGRTAVEDAGGAEPGYFTVTSSLAMERSPEGGLIVTFGDDGRGWTFTAGQHTDLTRALTPPCRADPLRAGWRRAPAGVGRRAS